MTESQKTLFLLDGMALAYRGHFGLIRNPRMTSTGMNVSIGLRHRQHDSRHPEQEQAHPHCRGVRHARTHPPAQAEYPEYKAQRDAMPEDLSIALPYLFRLIEGFNIPVIRVPGWEADDVIGTLAKQADEAGFTTFMVTSGQGLRATRLRAVLHLQAREHRGLTSKPWVWMTCWRNGGSSGSTR